MATNAIIEFILYGDKLIPGLISKELLITPSRIHIKGEKSKINNIPRENSWEINTNCVETIDLNILLFNIYNQIESKINIINQLKDKYELKSVLGIIIYIEDKICPALSVDSKIIKFLDVTNTSIEFDFYVS